MFWGKVIAQQLMSFSIVLNKIMLNSEDLFCSISVRGWVDWIYH